jgi:hypothetical protein
LNLQVLGHGFALSFVIFESCMADCRSLGIKNDSQVLRFFIVDHFPEHVYEPIDSIGRKALGGGKALDGIIGAVKERISVD